MFLKCQIVFTVKAQKRKWHEEKLIAKLEKDAAKKHEEEERKKAKIDEEAKEKTEGLSSLRVSFVQLKSLFIQDASTL